MVAPFVPYSRTTTVMTSMNIPAKGGLVRYALFSQTRVGSKQRPPFNLDTTYTFRENRSILNYGVESPGDANTMVNQVAATNQARAKFVGELGNSSSIGATLTAERRETWGTVVSGVTNTLLAAKAVSRGKLVEAAKILGFSPPTKTRVVKRRTRRGRITISRSEVWVMPGGRQVVKSLGNKWLWFSYGVQPLVSDIYNAMDVLIRDQPYRLVSGKGYAKSSWAPAGYYSDKEKYTASSSVSISAHVRVANPNLWLANQLGLINPVQWINEAIPFSFVIDWFSNLSQVISQLTDFVGLEIAKPVTTSKHVGTFLKFHPEYGNMWCGHQLTIFDRALSIPSARIHFAYERFYWQRGANAISLLVGFLKRA